MSPLLLLSRGIGGCCLRTGRGPIYQPKHGISLCVRYSSGHDFSKTMKTIGKTTIQPMLGALVESFKNLVKMNDLDDPCSEKGAHSTTAPGARAFAAVRRALPGREMRVSTTTPSWYLLWAENALWGPCA